MTYKKQANFQEILNLANSPNVLGFTIVVLHKINQESIVTTSTCLPKNVNDYTCLLSGNALLSGQLAKPMMTGELDDASFLGNLCHFKERPQTITRKSFLSRLKDWAKS